MAANHEHPNEQPVLTRPNHQLDSPFQLTEHLKALHYSLTHPAGTNTTTPLDASTVPKLLSAPSTASKDIWLYELCRFLIQKTNTIIVALFADDPPCSSATCPEMRASEWQYLCAVHDPPKSCAAIDYCCHTLDWAANCLTSSKTFPSRLGLGSGLAMAAGDKVLVQQMKEIKNIFRRVYRIYAHAWFQHREMFWRVEGQTGLFCLFQGVCRDFAIIESENYTIPIDAEGRELPPPQSKEQEQQQQHQYAPPKLLQRGQLNPEHAQPEPLASNVLTMGDTTKRHRHTRSDLSDSTSVIEEEVEEDDEEASNQRIKPAIPSLPRETTALKDDEAAEAPAEDVTNAEQELPSQDEEPVPGIGRSDTMRLLTSNDDVAGESNDNVEDESPIETPTNSKSISASDDQQVGVADGMSIEAPQEQTAAEGEEATKTVGD